jgi:hypothetical protein
MIYDIFTANKIERNIENGLNPYHNVEEATMKNIQITPMLYTMNQEVKVDENDIIDYSNIVIPHNVDATFWEQFEEHMAEDEFGLKPVLVLKKSTYSQAHRRAQQKYREKFPEKYCEIQRKLYDERKTDEEWKKRFNERSRINNKKYREKRNQAILEAGGSIKARGRPRKEKEEKVEPEKVEIQNVIELKPEEEVKPEVVMIDEPKPKRKYTKKPKAEVVEPVVEHCFTIDISTNPLGLMSEFGCINCRAPVMMDTWSCKKCNVKKVKMSKTDKKELEKNI